MRARHDRAMEQPAAAMVDGQVIHCRGSWTLPHLSVPEEQLRQLRAPKTRVIEYDLSGITAMDTGGAVLLQHSVERLRASGVRVTLLAPRPEFSDLLGLVQRHRDRLTGGAPPTPVPSIERYRHRIWRHWESDITGLAFLGETAVALLRAISRPGRIRWRSLLHVLEIDGVRALPITGLLTFLVGVVIAYQGAEQLRKFGTNIFIVDLVGISLLREIAPLIVAILIAGRSGSAYTAQIGTMRVTEELDAVRTIGISPMDLLVLPRVWALIIAMPLLTLYADVLGSVGGMLIAANQLNVSVPEFVARFEEAVPLRHFLIGIAKAPFFAVIIAMVGCYQGFQIQGGVDDVARRTTVSVVQSIFLVIIFDAVCSILLSWWDL
ncbi:MAG TPA: MlaE family lipid ABC transporter permease subunit [Nitrospira sp.]|nr:MlaE family lipid ABC transporter permease subunit [Nitrospira sp.]